MTVDHQYVELTPVIAVKQQCILDNGTLQTMLYFKYYNKTVYFLRTQETGSPSGRSLVQCSVCVGHSTLALRALNTRTNAYTNREWFECKSGSSAEPVTFAEEHPEPASLSEKHPEPATFAEEHRAPATFAEGSRTHATFAEEPRASESFPEVF